MPSSAHTSSMQADHRADPVRSESCPTPTLPPVAGAADSLRTLAAKDAEHLTDPPSRVGLSSRLGRVCSAPCHFSPRISQDLTESLLNNSEQSSQKDLLLFETRVQDDWSEASFGWKLVVPYAKYVTQQTRFRSPKKGRVRAHSDVPCLPIECLDDDRFNPWKAAVRPDTYQYVPNNGCYRTNKPGPSRVTKQLQDWLASKSPRSIKERQLKKAGDLMKRDQQKDQHHLVDPCDDHDEVNRVAVITAVDNTSSAKRLPVQAVINQKDRASEMLHFAAKRLQPHGQKPIKSAATSERFMADFHTRLSALERGTRSQCVSGVSRATDSSTASAGHFPGQIASTVQVKDYIPNTTRLAIQKKNVQRYNYGEELFTVVPMCKAETPRLRPLEKVTPKQKQGEGGAAGEESPSSAPHADETGAQKDSQDPSAPSTAELPASKLPDSCGISLARSAIARTNFRIEQMRNSPLRSTIGSTKPKAFFVHKGSGLALLKNGAVRYTITKNTWCLFPLVNEVQPAGYRPII